MSDAPFLWLCLGIATVCLVTITLTMLVLAGELRQTLQDGRRTFRQGRRLLARANAATGRVEAVIHQACDAAADALGAIGRLKTRTRMLWMKRFGNGAGAEPRRHHRGR